MDYAYDNLLVAVADRIGTVTVNRPDKLNALNSDTEQELQDVFLKLRDDEMVGGVIVTGAGSKAFVAGADIAELSGLGATQGRSSRSRGRPRSRGSRGAPSPSSRR